MKRLGKNKAEPAFTIYYGDGTKVSGRGHDDWRDAPDDDVQVVVVHEPWPDPLPDREKTGFVYCGRRDATFYTGVDQYDPLQTGKPKFGRLSEDYWTIWDRAYGDG